MQPPQAWDMSSETEYIAREDQWVARVFGRPDGLTNKYQLNGVRVALTRIKCPQAIMERLVSELKQRLLDGTTTR